LANSKTKYGEEWMMDIGVSNVVAASERNFRNIE
jgi:hypothetical protein